MTDIVFTNLQNAARDKFLADIVRGGKRGLWVYGPRQSGTTTYARSFVDPVYEVAPTPEWDKMAVGNLITAVALEDMQREKWNYDSLLRANGEDINLWVDVQTQIDKWDDVWNANVLMINDLIAPDVEFWKRHLLHRVTDRLKGPGVTIIVGLYGPQKFGPDWSTGFADLCMVIQMSDRGEG